MTVTLKELRDSAQMDSSAFQSVLDARPSQRRDDETMEAYVIRLIRSEERERCAQIAEFQWRVWRTNLTDDPIGMDACADIATAIREQTE